MLVSHEPRRVNLQAASPPATPAERIIRKPYHAATLESCEDQKTKAVTTLWELAESIGMSTGAVTTAAITHATPGATYSHIANRDWEADSACRPKRSGRVQGHRGRQLVEMAYGDGFEVAMGGGRSNFLPEARPTRRTRARQGERKDGPTSPRSGCALPNSGAYRLEPGAIRGDRPGLDRPSARALRAVAHGVRATIAPKDTAGEPSLAQMTEKAIDILSQNPEGYLLLIEGGRIDHGSHDGNAFRTVTDGVALNEAVKAALRKVNLNETLIVVTGDHSHTLTIAGYAKRGNPILGISIGVDGEPILGTTASPTRRSASPTARAA